MQREQLSSRMGFLLLSAGCAIGVGNVWKFPWLTGQNGGGIFVLAYLVFLILLGLPVMTMEFAVGRASQKSPVCMYQKIEPAGSKWHWHGYAALAGNVILMMFYSVVSGWMLYYLVSSANGSLASLDPQSVGGFFGELLTDAPKITFYTLITVIGAFIILAFPLRNGLEKVSKWMMGSLFILMLFLAIHSLLLDGAAKGLSFYLLPDFSKVTSNTIVAAMNQAFFSLSIGIGSMAIFASYINKEQSLVKESINVICLDTIVAILAGLIIFPACFTYGVKPSAGPSLIFEALPNIFNEMAYGRVWGTFFFLFMTFATFSTVLAVCEAILSCVRDLTHWSRPNASLVCGTAVAILSLPCALGFSVLSDFQPLGPGTAVLDLEDFIVSNLLLPLGSFCFVLFCTRKCGWGWKNYLAEVNTGKGLKMPTIMRFYCTWILPLIILAVFTIGIIPYLKLSFGS